MSIKTGFHFENDPVVARADSYTDFVTLDVSQGLNEVTFFVRTLDQALAIQKAAKELVRLIAEMTLPVNVEELMEALNEESV